MDLNSTSIKFIRSVLDGDVEGLMRAFSWGMSPQGHAYWHTIHKNYVTHGIPLPSDARTILEEMIGIKQKKKTGFGKFIKRIECST